MLGAIKDIMILIVSVVVVAHATGRREWLWKQVTTIRQEVLIKANDDWGCPSIFNKNSCYTLNSHCKGSNKN